LQNTVGNIKSNTFGVEEEQNCLGNYWYSCKMHSFAQSTWKILWGW